MGLLYPALSYNKHFYLSFQVVNGVNVAARKDKKSKDSLIKIGNKSKGNNIPTRIDLEKSSPTGFIFSAIQNPYYGNSN